MSEGRRVGVGMSNRTSVKAVMDGCYAMDLKSGEVKDFPDQAAMTAFMAERAGDPRESWEEIPYALFGKITAAKKTDAEILTELRRMQGPSPGIAYLLEAVTRMFAERIPEEPQEQEKE